MSAPSMRNRTLKIDVIDGDNILHGRYSHAFVEITYNNSRRRTSSVEVTNGRCVWTTEMKFFMDEPPSSTALLRLVLDSDSLGSKERTRSVVNLDDCLVSGKKHIIRLSLGGFTDTQVQLTACVLGENDQEPELIGKHGSPWTQGRTRVTVGTQTVLTGSGRVKLSEAEAWIPSQDEVSVPAVIGAPSVSAAGTPSSSRNKAFPTTLPTVGRSTLDPQSGIAKDIELVKSLMAAWPVDEVEGMLVYVEKLRREKEDLEAQLVRRNLDVARAGAREMARAPLSPIAAARPAQHAMSVRLLEPPFLDDPETEELVSRVTLIHGQPLTVDQKKHLLDHYDHL